MTDKMPDEPTLLVCDLPLEILQAATKLDHYFKSRGFKNWKFGGCQSRPYQEAPQLVKTTKLEPKPGPLGSTEYPYIIEPVSHQEADQAGALYTGKTFSIQDIEEAHTIATAWAGNPYPPDRRLLAAVKLVSDAALTPLHPEADQAEALEDLETLRWLLNISNADNTPGITVGSAMDRHENTQGESNRIILERVYKNTKALLQSPPSDERIESINKELLDAAKLQEKAELYNANCKHCGGEDVPELCPKCFPKFDDARLNRRAAIANAKSANAHSRRQSQEGNDGK